MPKKSLEPLVEETEEPVIADIPDSESEPARRCPQSKKVKNPALKHR